MTTNRKLKLVTTASKTDHARALNDVHGFLGRYMAFTFAEQADAVALWIAHTYAIDAADASPRLSIQSAEKQSGKTRLLELLDALVRRPESVASISASAMFRLIGDSCMTLLIDEADTIFTRNGGRSEDLRGILNAGYKRNGSVLRVESGEVVRFPVFAPVAMAGIGELPDTVQDRSIIIRLKRRKRSDHVAPLRRREVENEASALRDGIESWVELHGDALTQAMEMPAGLSDRAADIWEPLFAIASQLGGTWPERALHAALKLSVSGSGERSQGARLLSDVRRIFAAKPRARVTTAELLNELSAMDDRAYEGAIDVNALAKTLAPFDIRPKSLRLSPQSKGTKVNRGYEVADFTDAFARYLPAMEGE